MIDKVLNLRTPEIIKALAYLQKHNVELLNEDPDLKALVQSAIIEASNSRQSQVQVPSLRANTFVDGEILTRTFQQISDDLYILYALIVSLEEDSSKVFGYLLDKQSLIDSSISSGLSVLADAEIRTGAFHSGVDVSSFPFDSETERNIMITVPNPLNIDAYGSAVTLGHAKDPIEHTTARIEILPESNGTVGLSSDGNVVFNDISAVLTDSTNSFIYERVGDFRDSLNLKLSFRFGSQEILNNLLVEIGRAEDSFSPILTSLELSQDGITWNKVNEYDLTLRGINSIYFLPQLALFARLTVTQKNKLPLNGGIMRELIELKKIIFRTFTYHSEGEFIGKTIEIPNEVIKVRVMSDKIGSSKDVQHAISPNGEQWFDLPEAGEESSILTFNLEPDSIFNGSPVTKLIYKLKLTNKDFQPTIDNNAELVYLEQLPLNGKTADLSFSPLPGTLRLALDLGATIGGTRPYKITNYSGLDNDWTVIDVPFYVQEGRETLIVDNRIWSRVDLGTISDMVTENNGLIYQYDYENRKIYFPKRQNQSGEAFSENPAGREIKLKVKAETPIPEANNRLRLTNSSVGVKDAIKLYSVSMVPRQYTERILSTKRQTPLLRRDILNKVGWTPTLLEAGPGGSLRAWGVETKYLGGQIEFQLNTAATYSIDYDEGVLYFSPAADIASIRQIKYYVLHKNLVMPSKWSLVPGSLNIIEINDLGLFRTGSAVVVNQKHAQLLDPDFGRIKFGSIALDSFQEVSYINGYGEFEDLIPSNRSLAFSVDYSKNEIYFYTEYTGTITFQQLNVLAEYPIGLGIAAEQYKNAGKTVIFSDEWLLDLLEEDKRLMASYKYNPTPGVTGTDMSQYYSPVVFGSSVMTLNRSQVLGG